MFIFEAMGILNTNWVLDFKELLFIVLSVIIILRSCYKSGGTLQYLWSKSTKITREQGVSGGG